MHQIALGYLSVFGLPPVQFIDLAAALDCRHISIFLRGGPLLPLDYPSFSLTKDPALRQESAPHILAVVLYRYAHLCIH